MEEVFEFNGQEYSLFEVEEAAKAKQISIDDYINQYNISRKPGKTTPTTPGAVVEETVAPVKEDTELTSVDTSSELQQIELSGFESIKNSLYNIGTDFGRIIDFWTGDSAALDIASAAIANSIFGEENVEEFIKENKSSEFLIEGLGTQEILEKIPEREKEKQLRKPTLEIIESFKEGEFLEGGAAIASAFLNTIGSAAYGVATAGAGFFMDYAADNYIEYNKGLAKRKGKSLEQLIQDDEADTAMPMGIAYFQAFAENTGLGEMISPLKKEAAKTISKNIIGKKFGPKGLAVLKAARVEAGTEMFQYGAEEYNKKLGETGSQKEAATEFVNAVFSQQGFESGLQGAFGGAGLKGANLLKASNNSRTPSNAADIDNDLNELSALNKKYNLSRSNTVKEGIQQQIDVVNNRLKERIQKNNKVVEKLTDKEIREINNLGDLADTQSQRVQQLNEELQNGEITRKEYSDALKGFQATYDESKNKINKIILEKEIETVKTVVDEGDIDVVETIEEFKEKYPEIDIQADAFITGEGKIVINKERAAKVGAVTAASHELLHKILRSAFSDQNQKNKLINDFKNTLSTKERSIVEKRINDNYRYELFNSEKEYETALKDNKNTAIVKENIKNATTTDKGQVIVEFEEEFYNDEYLTAFSDAVGLNQISYNENLFTKLGDYIINILKPKGYTNLKFESGKDVYNFIKDYQKNIQKGIVKDEVAALAGKDIKGKTQFSKSDIKQSLDKLVQTPEGTKKYNTKEEFQTSEDYIKAYEAITQSNLLDGVIMQGMTEKGLSGQSMANFIDNVKDNLTERFVKNFDPAKNDSLFGWLLGKTPIVEKAKLDVIATYAKKVDKESIEREVDGKVEARSIIDEGPSIEEIVDMSLEQTDRAPKSKLRRELKVDNKTGIDQALIDKIKTSVEETFKGELPNVKDKAFRKKLINQYRAKLKAPIAKLIGGGKKYKDFLIENKETLLNNLPISYLVQIERKIPENERIFSAPVKRLTTQKEIDKANQAGLLYVENEAVGPMLYKKLMPTDKEFLDFYGVSDDVNLGSTKGTRKDELARIIGVTMAVDMTPTVIREKAAEGKVTQQEQAKIAEKIQRDPTLKFSLTTKKIRIFDFDDTLAESKSNVLYTMPNGKKGKLNAGQFAKQGDDLAKQGAKFDFSEFTKVIDGEKGPLFDVAKKIIDARGSENIYILTARPENAKYAIKQFLDALGLPFNINNIIGLGNGSPQAKADWVKNKIKEGFNDVYFADDAIKNVQAVKDALKDEDIKSRVQQAKKQAKIAEKIQRDPTLKFSLTTKAEGKWEQDPLNPLADYAKKYDFKVGSIDYTISTVKSDEAGIDYNEFENELGLEADIIIDDPKSIAIAFTDEKGEAGITEAAQKRLTNQFKVFGTVANSVIDLVKKDNLNSVTLTAKEKSRQRLYQSLVNRFSEELGWDTYSFEDESGVIFIAYNPEVFVTIADPNPAPIKYSYNLQNKNWPAQKKEIIKKAGIFQEFMGDIKTTLGSVRPSHVITSDLFEGKDKGAIEIAIKAIRDGIKDYKTKNKNSLLKEGEKYGPPQVIYGSSPEKIQENIDNGIILKNKNTFDRIFNDMWSRIYDMLETYPEMEDFIENFLKISNNDVSHPQRLGAIFSGFDPKAKFNKDFFRRYEYEHAVQSHIVWKTLLNSAKINAAKKNKLQFTKDLFDIKQNYVMLAISIEDNNKVAKAGYAHKMPKNWKKWWNRYFNKDVAAINGGINPNKLTFIEYSDEKAIIKGTIAEEFNIKNAKGERTATQFSKTLSQDFNKIIEDKTGIAADEVYKKAKAEVVGASKGKWRFFIPPGAEDFVGLLYATLGKGKLGDQQMAWYKYNLLNPYTDALNNITRDRVQLAKDFKELKKQLKIVPKNLRKKVGDSLYTQQNAVRVYIWNKQGIDMLTEENGMDKNDLNKLIKFVEEDNNLLEFANKLMEITQGEYAGPGAKWWNSGTIDADLLKTLSTTRRAKYLEESGWTENVKEIFSEENLNKLEAAYGKPYRIALENILARMKSGRNRSFGGDALTGRFTDWISNSIGTIMFLNSRSAVLQTISAVNFINWSDNNLYAAAKAFANPKQWSKDFMTLMNSPFLIERRNGLKIDVNESEIADLANTSTNKAKAIMGQLLKAGFLPTQIADSFAIASGGASFYRNRINSLVKAGYTTAEAEKIAMRDFRETATESQQSSDPSRISQQQAGPLGRIVLAFANTPAQYARLTKKAVLDIKNGRGDLKTNVSKIIYYMVVQNIIFTALQQALFAVAFGDEDDEDEINKKYIRMGNSMADSILRGLGFAGAAVSVAKNVAIKIAEESGKKAPKFEDAAWKLLEISPPISSKVSKFRSAGRTFSWNKKEIKKEGLSIDNPAAMAGAQIIAGSTNLPVDRVLRKINNVQNAISEDAALWQRIALLSGWQSWELGMQDKKKKKKKTTTTKKSIR